MTVKSFTDIVRDYTTYLTPDAITTLTNDLTLLESLIPFNLVSDKILAIHDMLDSLVSQTEQRQQSTKQTIVELDQRIGELPVFSEEQRRRHTEELQQYAATHAKLELQITDKEKRIETILSQKVVNETIATILKEIQRRYQKTNGKYESLINYLLGKATNLRGTFQNMDSLVESYQEYAAMVLQKIVLPLGTELRTAYEALNVLEQDDFNMFLEMLTAYLIAFDCKNIAQQDTLFMKMSLSSFADHRQNVQSFLTGAILRNQQAKAARVTAELETLKQEAEKTQRRVEELKDIVSQEELHQELLHERQRSEQSLDHDNLPASIHKHLQEFVRKLYAFEERLEKRKNGEVVSFPDISENSSEIPLPATEPTVQELNSWSELVSEKIYLHDKAAGDRQYYVGFSAEVLSGLQSIPQIEQNKYFRALRHGFGSKYKESCIKFLDKDTPQKKYCCSIKVLGDKWRIKAVEKKHQGKKLYYFCWFGDEKQGC